MLPLPQGHAPVVSALLAAGADPYVRAKIGSKLTPLHLAAYFGHTDVCLVLVQQGHVPLTVPDGNNGATPLHHAAGQGHAGTVSALVQAGASLAATNSDGFTALHWAAQNVRSSAGCCVMGVGQTRVQHGEPGHAWQERL